MKKVKNRKGRSGSFSGSTRRIFQRISEGKGRSYLLKMRKQHSQEYRIDEE
jgi:hypothetical protein